MTKTNANIVAKPTNLETAKLSDGTVMTTGLTQAMQDWSQAFFHVLCRL